MSSLIVVHGVGDPSEHSLREAAHGVASAFPWVAEENSSFVNWNALAADRVLHGGQFRWGSVKRMFQALRVAIQVGWMSGAFGYVVAIGISCLGAVYFWRESGQSLGTS